MRARPGQIGPVVSLLRGGAAPRNVIAPTDLTVRNWWRAPVYDAATGLWAASAGSRMDTLAQAVAAKRPTKANNPAYNNLPTVDADGVDDDLLVVAPALDIQPNTVGVLFDTTAAVAGDYLVGQYATISYQFYRANQAADTLSTDPSGSSYAAAGVATPHLWLLSKSGAVLTAYRDGIDLGNVAMASSAGVGTTFYLFSAGGGYIAASVAELFTIDGTITAAQALGLTNYFRGQGYPL